MLKLERITIQLGSIKYLHRLYTRLYCHRYVLHWICAAFHWILTVRKQNVSDNTEILPDSRKPWK